MHPLKTSGTRCVATPGLPWVAVSPLMHAAGIVTAFAAIMAGLTVVLYDTSKKLDPQLVWQNRGARESGA